MPGTTAAVSPWLRRFHPAPDAAVRVVFFPHAGGSASYFYPHSQALSPEYDVLAIQYPGRQDRLAETPIDQLDQLAAHCAHELAPWLDRPTVLFGHSMGAALAFETTRILEAQGKNPMALVASAARGPAIPRETKIHQKTDDGLIQELATLNGTSTEALGDRDLLEMVLPSLRSDYKAIETYCANEKDQVQAPVLVLTGKDDDRVTQDQAAQWQNHTTATTTTVEFPGGHFFITPHQDEVLNTLKTTIKTWQ